jgi:hypothetical protein
VMVLKAQVVGKAALQKRIFSHFLRLSRACCTGNLIL